MPVHEKIEGIALNRSLSPMMPSTPDSGDGTVVRNGVPLLPKRSSEREITLATVNSLRDEESDLEETEDEGATAQMR